MKVFQRIISICLSFYLVFPAQALSAGQNSSPSMLHLQEQPPNFRQLVIFVPDLFDHPEKSRKALAKLQTKGIPPQDIIDLTGHPEFDRKAGLKSQAAQIAKIVEMESARRQGLRAHLIAKGSGGLAARFYLASARAGHLRGAPVESVVGLGVPHQGRYWAKWAYHLALPLPRVGDRAKVVRDLAPDSSFLQELNMLDRKRQQLLLGAKSALEAVRKYSFNHQMKNQLSAIDQEKFDVAQKVEQFLLFPERIDLTDNDLRLIRQLKGEQKAFQDMSEKITNSDAKDIFQDLNQWSKQLRQMQEKTAQRVGRLRPIENQTASGGHSEKTEKLIAVLEAQAFRTHDQLLSFLGSSGLYSLEDVPLADIHALQETIQKQNQQWLQETKRLDKTAIQAMLGKLIQVIKNLVREARADQSEAMNDLTGQARALDQQKAVWIEKLDRTLDKRAQRELKRYQRVSFERIIRELQSSRKEVQQVQALNQALEIMRQSRKNWHLTAAAYARDQAQVRFQSDFASYLRQFQTWNHTAFPDEVRQALKGLENLEKKIKAPTLKQSKETALKAFGQYQSDQKSFVKFAKQMTGKQSKPLVREEYFVYLERLWYQERVLRNAIKGSSVQVQPALLAVTQAPAAREMELFARATRKRLDRARQILKYQLAPGRFLLKTRPAEELLSTVQTRIKQTGESLSTESREAQALTALQTDINKALSEYLQDTVRLSQVETLHEDLTSLENDLNNLIVPQTRKEQSAPSVASLCHQLSLLETAGQAEQTLKVISAQDTDELKKNREISNRLQDLADLSKKRRELVRALASAIAFHARDAISWNWASWAARLTVLAETVSAWETGSVPKELAGQISQASQSARQIADQQRQGLSGLEQTLGQYKDRLALRLLRQAAADQVQNQVLTAAGLFTLKSLDTRLLEIETALALSNAQRRSYEQLIYARDRMQALQGKANEYLQALKRIKMKLGNQEIQKDLEQWDKQAQVMTAAFDQPVWDEMAGASRKSAQRESSHVQSMLHALAAHHHHSSPSIEGPLAAVLAAAKDMPVKQAIAATGFGPARQADKKLATKIRAARKVIAQNIQAHEVSLASVSLPALKEHVQHTRQPDFNHQAAIAPLRKMIDKSQALIQATEFSGNSVAKAGNMKNAQRAARSDVHASANLLNQQAAQSHVLRQMDQVMSVEDIVKTRLDALSSEAKRAWEKSGLFNEMKKLGITREKMTTVVEIMNKSVYAHMQSQGWKLNTAKLESASTQLNSLFKILPPKSRPLLGPQYRAAVAELDKIGHLTTRDIAKQIVDLDMAQTWNQLGRALGQAGDLFSQAGSLVQAGRAPPDIGKALQGLTDVNKLYEVSVYQAAAFMRQQATRVEVQRHLDKVASLGFQAEVLLDQHMSNIQVDLAKSGFMRGIDEAGLSATAYLALDQAATQFGLNASLNSIHQELNNLQNIKTTFSEGLDRQLLEIQRADAAMVVELITQKFNTLGNDISAVWKSLTYQIDPGHWSFDPAFNLSNLGQFGLDQELLQSFQQDIFNKLLESNPVLKEFEKVGNLSGQLDALALQGGQELKTWLSGTGVYARVEKLSQLKQKAESLLDRAMNQGETELLKGDLGKLLRQMGLESHEISGLMNSVSGPLKDMIMESEVMQQLNLLQQLPDFINSHMDTLLIDLECVVRNTGFMRSLEGLSQQFGQVWDQLSGNKPLNLSALGLQLTQGFGQVGKAGEKVLGHLQDAIGSLGSSNSALALWDTIYQGLQDFAGGLVKGLRDFIVAAGHVDLGAAFLNFTSFGTGLFVQAGDLLGGFLSDVFEFRFDIDGNWFGMDSVWDQAADIFNSELFQFDIFQAADGFMRSLEQGLASLTEGGLRWINNRWQEYYGQAVEYLDILAGGPARWLDEIASGRWDASIGGLLDRYLPPDWQPARSALQQVALVFGENFTFSAGFLTGVLDDLSAYLSADARAIYGDIRNLYDQGQEAYTLAETTWQSIQTGDLTSVVSMASRLLGSLNLLWGPVYQSGQGRADKLGGYRGEDGGFYTNPLDEYLAQMDPELRAEVQKALKEQRFGSPTIDPNAFDVARYAGYPPGAYLTTSAVEGGARGQGAGYDPSLPYGFDPNWNTGPDDRGPPRMNGVPTPPGYVYDEEKQKWVKAGEEEGEGEGDGAGEAKSSRAGASSADAEAASQKKQGFWDKVKNVYKNTRPAGLAKNAALAAAPGVKAVAEKTADAATKAAKKAAKVAKDAAKKAANTAKKAAEIAKKAAAAAKNAANKAIKYTKEKTKETIDNSGNYIENVMKTANAIKEHPEQSLDLLRGLRTSHQSGDMWDRQPKVEYEKDGPAILYINGMNTSSEQSKEQAKSIGKYCGGTKVARVENNTHGLPAGDAAQVAGHEMKTIDITAIRAADAMKKAINDPDLGEIYVIAHSQGSAVFDQALRLLTAEERKKVHYQGFGPQKYIDSGELGLGSARNVRHARDRIPNFNDMRERVGIQSRSENWEVVGTKKEDEDYNLQYHDFERTYLRHMYVPLRKRENYDE